MAAVGPLGQFDGFRPSFLSVGIGWLPDLYKRAFDAARSDMRDAIDADSTDGTRVATGIIGPPQGITLPIRFGHLENAPKGVSADLSGMCPYTLSVEISGGSIRDITLRLNILNPRFILFNETFKPASVDAAGAFKELTNAVVPVGVVVLADPSEDPAQRFTNLKAGLSDSALNQVVQNYRPYSYDTLLCRFDLTMTWSIDKLAKIETDNFGFVVGIPGGELPAGVVLTTVSMFSPEVQATFNGLLRPSGGFGICLPRSNDENIVLLMKALKRPAADASAQDKAVWALYSAALKEFGLTEDFKGILLSGLEVHWLSDNNVGHSAQDIDVSLGVSAFSFGGSGHDVNSSATSFVSFEAGIKPSDDSSYLALLSDLRVSAALAKGEPKRFSLAAKFRGDLAFPYAWLAGRAIRFTLSLESWTDSAGNKREGKVIGCELHGADDRILARINADEPVAIDPGIFSAVAVAITMAPIVASSGSIDTQAKGIPPNANLRGYFADIQKRSMSQLYAVAGLGWFFRNAIEVDEIRVVGIKLQSQPAAINGGPEGKSDTALLFDYEVDYRVELKEAKIESKYVTTRIDGTGIVVAGPDLFRWVQVPTGLRELSLADPGLWDLGPVGKLLKLTEVTIRKEPRKELVLRLALSGNLGIISAGDFAFSIDLQDGNGLKLESYPSKVTVKLPGVLDGSGSFVIDKSGAKKEILGSLDLTVKPIGLRFYAGARVTKVDTTSGDETTAVLATGEVEFTTMIPLASSGLGLRSISALYAMHFARIELETPPAVPPALDWLSRAGGNVVTSVEYPQSKTLWAPKYDNWSFGIGVGLGLQSSDFVANLNSMLVLSIPGPTVIIFSKLNILQIPKLNKDIAGKLTTGLLGIIEIDLAREEITLGILADVKFRSFFSFHAPIEMFFALRNLSRWHIYLGHFENPISAKLDIFSVVSLSASGYFMVAGDRIAHAPVPGGPIDLPGTALAIGAKARVQIGGGSLYLRVELANHLFVSIAKSLFAYGDATLAGELRLFIVSIGASGTFGLQYLQKPGGDTRLYISGQICGHVKLVFVKISGCVSLHIGSPITENTPFDALVEGVSILSGARVALRGQGATGTFDGELAKLPVFNGTNGATKVPLDAVIALKMPVPPKIGPNPIGFAKTVGNPDEGKAEFHLGSRLCSYQLDSVTLKRQVGAKWVDVDYNETPGRWWSEPQSQKGGQPVPRQLALLTRNPLAVTGTVTSPPDLDAWVAAILGGICDPAIPPQMCLFEWLPTQAGTGLNGDWVLPAHLPNADIIQKIGTSGAVPEKVHLMMRHNANTPNDPVAGLPPYVGGCESGPNSANDARYTYLRLMSRWVPNTRVTSPAVFQGEILFNKRTPIEFLIAQRLFKQDHIVEFELRDAMGASQLYRLNSPEVTRRQLGLDDAKSFHQDEENWKHNAEAFVNSQNDLAFRQMTFEHVTLAADPGDLGGPPVSLTIRFNSDIGTADPLTLLIAGVKLTPLAELTRYNNDVAEKAKAKAELLDFLNSPQVPLLEPATEYRMDIAWKANGDGTGPQAAEYHFTTTNEPPRDVTPYLITTFPTAGEQFHYADDWPGVVLGSNDLLRALAKFPQARLRVTITEDGGNEVLSPSGTRKWNEGVVVDPAELLDSIVHPVDGFQVISVAALPTALEQAIQHLADEGGDLSCLGNFEIPEAALWIGFKSDLRPLSGYVITIEIVDAGNPLKVWAFESENPKGDEPLLKFTFSTGLHRNLKAHLAMFGNAVVRHRNASAQPQFDNLLQPIENGVAICPDKTFEDAIANIAGERSDRNDDARITMLWEGNKGTMNPTGIVLESNEPLVRRTKSAAIQVAQGQDYVAELVDMLLQSIDLANSTGLADVVVSASGFGLFARINSPPGSDIIVAFNERSVDRIPRDLSQSQFKIDGTALRSRVSPATR